MAVLVYLNEEPFGESLIGTFDNFEKAADFVENTLGGILHTHTVADSCYGNDSIGRVIRLETVKPKKGSDKDDETVKTEKPKRTTKSKKVVEQEEE